MNAERAQVGWRFWLGWVLASTVGVVVGLTVGTFVQDSAVTWGNVLGGAVIGASIGTAQWLVLRRQISRSGWWVLASTVGAIVGNVMGGVAFGAGAIGGWAVFGGSIGTAQWLVLRRQVSRSGCWVLASTVTVAVVGVPTYAPALVWASLIALAGYGAITGGVLVWLLRQPSREA